MSEERALRGFPFKLDDDGLAISSPGGFIEGVGIGNLLVTPPRSRNPLLADIIKRIGLAERTGRGIDRIFEGMLRYGRPAPDYSMSTDYTVAVLLSIASDTWLHLPRCIQKRADVMELCRISKDQAYKLLLRLKKQGDVVQTGERKAALYERKR